MRITRQQLRKLILLEMERQTAFDMPSTKQQQTYFRNKAGLDPETRQKLSAMDKDSSFQGYELASMLGSQEMDPGKLDQVRIDKALNSIPGVNELKHGAPGSMDAQHYDYLKEFLSGNRIVLTLQVLLEDMIDHAGYKNQDTLDDIHNEIVMKSIYSYNDIPYLVIYDAYITKAEHKSWNSPALHKPGRRIEFHHVRDNLSSLAYGEKDLNGEMKIDHAVLNAILDLDLDYIAYITDM